MVSVTNYDDGVILRLFIRASLSSRGGIFDRQALGVALTLDNFREVFQGFVSGRSRFRGTTIHDGGVTLRLLIGAQLSKI